MRAKQQIRELEGKIAELEERSSMANPEKWLVDYFTGGVSDSGISVNETSALAYGAVYACVRVLAETVASMPLIVYRTLPNGGREKAVDHPLYPILHDSFNEEMTSFTGRETMQTHLGTWGNGYAIIARDERGLIPVSLWPVKPDKVRTDRWPETREVRYTVDFSAGKKEEYRPRDMLHIPGLSLNGITGLSPIGLMREAIGLGLALQKSNARLIANDSRPPAVMESDKAYSDQAYERLKKSLNEEHAGPDNKGKMLILEEGAKIHELGIKPEDAQFLQSRRFQVEEIARWYRVPPHMIGDLERSTNNNIEQQSMDFLTHTMRPWLRRWEQEINRKLFRAGDGYYAEFLTQDLLLADTAGRFNAYQQAINNGWMCPDEVRQRENLNPLPDGQGQKFFIPFNLMPLDAVDQLAAPGVAGQASAHKVPETRARKRAGAVVRLRLARSYQPIFEDAIRRTLKREAEDIKRQAQMKLGKRAAAKFSDWLDKYYNDTRFAQKQLKPVLKGYSGAISDVLTDEVGAEDIEGMSDFTLAYAEQYSIRHAASSRAKIQAIVDETADEETALDRLEAEVDSWPDTRAPSESMHEALKAGNAIAKFGMAAAGVSTLVWSAAGGKPCPICEEMDGTVIGIEQDFASEGDTLEAQGQNPLTLSGNVGHPPLHDGCECMIESGD